MLFFSDLQEITVHVPLPKTDPASTLEAPISAGPGGSASSTGHGRTGFHLACTVSSVFLGPQKQVEASVATPMTERSPQSR
jgi:hypothetical protein